MTIASESLQLSTPSAEEFIPVEQAVALVLNEAGGKPRHPATIYRWMSRGVRGHRLPYRHHGRRRFSTIRLVQAWLDATNASSLSGLNGRDVR